MEPPLLARNLIFLDFREGPLLGPSLRPLLCPRDEAEPGSTTPDSTMLTASV